jgi:hypothetical protein
MITPANSYLNAELRRKLTLVTEAVVYRKIGGFVGMAYGAPACSSLIASAPCA